MASAEQVGKIREQIVKQIDATFPEEQKESAKRKVFSMNEEQLEDFLDKNKLIQECVFCSIVKGGVPVYSVGENDKCIAILEINPISSGHTIVVPKEHIGSANELPKECFDLAGDVSERIKKKLNPKEVKRIPLNLFGHEVINILPVYDNEDINSPRKQGNPEQLGAMKDLLLEKEQEIIKEPEVKVLDEKKIWLPKRIP